MPPPARVDELKKRYEENPRRFFAPLANEYRKAGDLDAAIDLCRMHLEEQPGHLSGHIVYGQALYESSRAADAQRVFEAALTLDPENLIALRHLGDIAKAGGDATAARHWYGRVLEADPRNDEVIALIDALGQAASAPTVIPAEQHELPPPPNFAGERAPAPAIDPTAPAPAVRIAAVPLAPAAPEPRMSVGLMDLDLNLADSTGTPVDLLGIMSAEPAVPAEAAMVVETPPAVDEPAPAIDAGFSLVDTASSVSEIEGAGLPGLEGIALGAGADAGLPVDVHDTSFHAPPAEEESMFGAPHAEPSFGDSIDVVAAADFETSAAPTKAGPLGGLEMVDVGGSVPIGESVTEPRPAHAAPATPAEFDALFGHPPIADVRIGGDQALAPVEEAGFHADSFVGRAPADEGLAAAPDIATPPSPFVTETMAELYLQQGFRDEALGVYRQLLVQSPDDKGLAERVMHLEHATRSSLAIDSVSEEIEAEEPRRSGSIPTVPAEPVTALAVPYPELVPVVPQPELVPVVPQPGPAPTVELMPEPEPVTPAVVTPMPAAAGPLARDILSRIASRRAVPGGGFAEAAALPSDTAMLTPLEAASAEFTELTAVAAFAASSEPAASAATATAPTVVAPEANLTVAPGGAVDRLFGMSGVAAADEGAAVAMATAFGAAPPVAPIRGEPTRKGTDELSLDSVFGSDASARPSVVQRQSSSLRFDQFFSGAEGGESAPAAPPPPSTSPDASDDIAQFSNWLKGLKGS